MKEDSIQEQIRKKKEMLAKERAKIKTRPYTRKERLKDKLNNSLYYKVFQDRSRKEVDALCVDLNEVLDLNPPLNIIEKSEDIYVKSLLLACSFIDADDTLLEESWYLLFAHGLLLSATHKEYTNKYGTPKIKPLPSRKEFLHLTLEYRTLLKEMAFKPRIPLSLRSPNKSPIYDKLYEFVCIHAKSGFTQAEILKEYKLINPKVVDATARENISTFLSDALLRDYGGVIVNSVEDKGVMFAILPQLKLTLKEMEQLYESKPRPYLVSASKPESLVKVKKRNN